MKDAYVHCYLAGRCDYDEDDEEVYATLDELVAKVTAGSPMRDATFASAKASVTKELGVVEKAEWLKDNADTIKAMGGDSEKAWRLYMQGRIDALANDLEATVLDAIAEEEDDEDEDDEDDDDADGDDEDGDSDDDDDDDDDEEEPSRK